MGDEKRRPGHFWCPHCGAWVALPPFKLPRSWMRHQGLDKRQQRGKRRRFARSMAFLAAVYAHDKGCAGGGSRIPVARCVRNPAIRVPEETTDG